METQFYKKDRLLSKLTTLSYEQRLAFSTLIAECFWDGYTDFSSQQNWGKPSLLRKAIDIAWATIAGNEVAVDLDSFTERLVEVTPDTEKFKGIDAQKAYSAAAIVSYLVYFLKTRDTQYIGHQIQVAYEAAESLAASVLWDNDTLLITPEIEAQIREHPIVQNALIQFECYLEQVGSSDLLDSDQLAILKQQVSSGH